jgi:double-stranded uracil-DNA glycosylase
MTTPWRPTREQLAAAAERRLRDVIAPELRVLFCGINPGLYSTAVGHHFGRPGNRFWRALHGGGFTPHVFSAFDDRELLGLGLGITNLCPRTTARAEELTAEELLAGARSLERKLQRFRPRIVAILGLGAYRNAFGRPGAAVGLQPERVGPARVFVLPNPSGLNAHYGLADLARVFGELRAIADEQVSRLPEMMSRR